MRVLLDDLFSFAQVHDPSFEVACEPVRPADVLGDVLAGLYPQFCERGWEPRVLLDDEAVVQADAEALARIFRNLTANALRPVSYTHLDVYKRQQSYPTGRPSCLRSFSFLEW